MTTLAISQSLSPDLLRRAFGTFPTGVVAVAAEVAGEYVGLAASSFTSVSIDPPLASFAIANASKTWTDLRAASRLGVSVLAHCHSAVARQLAGPASGRFVGIPVTVHPGGALFLNDAVAAFDTTIHREVEAGDHTIVLLELKAVRDVCNTQPLVFHRGGFGLQDEDRGPRADARRI